MSVNEVAILILTLAPPFTAGHSPSTFEDDKTIGGDGDDMNIDDDDGDGTNIDGAAEDDTNIDGAYIILKTIRGYDDDKTIHGGGDDTNIDDDY